MIKQNIETRIYYIDFLKFVSILLVILAHVQAPNFIMQLRDFDVILLVFISSYINNISINNNISFRYFDYFVSKIKRLVIPTWLFLTFLYLILLILDKLPSLKFVVNSYLLQRDSSIAGYVWVIWVFLTTNLILPLIKQIDIKKLTHKIILILTILLYIFLSEFTNISVYPLLYNTFFTVIPYGFIALSAIIYSDHKITIKKLIKILSLIHILLLVIYYLIYNQYFMTVNFKYPVRLYFLSYGLPITLLLFLYFENRNLAIYKSKIVQFVSNNSLWIYLWHILFTNMFIYFFELYLWYIRYILILMFSLLFVYIQVSLTRILITRFPHLKKYFVVLRG